MSSFQPPPGYPQYPQQGAPQQPPQNWGTSQYPTSQPPSPPYQSPPQYPQQAPQYPQQPAYPQPPQQYPQQQAPAPTTGWYMPTAATVEAGYARAKEVAAEAAKARSGGAAGDMKFVKMPGPQGQTKWDQSVPIGYQSQIKIYLGPAWAPGVNYFVEGVTHFWKSQQHPSGTSIGCGGRECLVDESRLSLFKSGNENDAKRARSTMPPRKHFYYQGFLIEYGPQGHMSQTSPVMRPYVLDASGELHTKIQLIMQSRGFDKVIDRDGGRPLILVKRKTGPELQNVDWDCLDDNPMPLPHEYRGAQLWDLSKLAAGSTPQEQVSALQEVGLPLPPRAHGLLQAAPGAQPAQPWGPPPNQGWQQGPGAPPWGAPQPPAPMSPPQGAWVPPVPPQAGPPPQASYPQPPSFGNPAVPNLGAPPPPPPVSVPPPGNQGPGGYQAQPGSPGGYQVPQAPPPLLGNQGPGGYQGPAGPPPPPPMGQPAGGPPQGYPPPPPNMAPPTGHP
jgi:hypothetical protein